MTSTSIFAQARKKYLPSKVKLLFITEAPPTPDRNRYFFFEQVKQGDSLFLELMKVLFTEEVASFDTVKALRAEKVYFLERFQSVGFHLIHASDMPLPNTTATERRNTYRANLPVLMKQIDSSGGKSIPIVLVSAVVYEACFEGLVESGYQVINETMIEFPNSGQQINFRRKLTALLTTHNLMPEGL
ncbi:hypothetical protein Q0590_07030 [Rhodocytophaga aerolata]|uniref:Uncharacterized protein n=1 Tax=Rhodocytophaga aerolata TaxID=455078 RepID=A0ABT8R257_9BACT|nr:hypothetical protein [Rhodocytophaga aerolata]MDO1445999.1 hypothetical protein [Rhodocytophaga aerolata]